MRELPILFCDEMVRAILEGRKTQTRRVIKPQPPANHWWNADEGTMILASQYYPSERARRGCPYGTIGDRLWVRETWQAWEDPETGLDHLHYRADGAKLVPDWPNTEEAWARLCGKFDRWIPSIHMPRWASRITLEVTGVRVERVQDISGADAVAEGVTTACQADLTRWDKAAGGQRIASVAWENAARVVFHELWDLLNANRGYGWDVNPWVWVVEFSPAPQKGESG